MLMETKKNGSTRSYVAVVLSDDLVEGGNQGRFVFQGGGVVGHGAVRKGLQTRTAAAETRIAQKHPWTDAPGHPP